MRAVVLALVVGGTGGCDREPVEDTPTEIPADRLDAYRADCEDWCDLERSCEPDRECTCQGREFTVPLCLDKAIVSLRCRLELTCEELPGLSDPYAADRRCFGESVAETAACREG